MTIAKTSSETIGPASMLDELIAEIASQGWLLNNCYQIDTDLWRVNLRRPTGDGDYFSDWATGPTFVDALEECMSKLAEAEFAEAKAQTYSQAKPEPKTNLLQALGLVKP